MPFSFHICQIRTQLSFVQYHSCSSFNIRQRNKIKSRPTIFHSENRLLFIDRINTTSYIWSYPIRPSLFTQYSLLFSIQQDSRKLEKPYPKKEITFLGCARLLESKKNATSKFEQRFFSIPSPNIEESLDVPHRARFPSVVKRCWRTLWLLGETRRCRFDERGFDERK